MNIADHWLHKSSGSSLRHCVQNSKSSDMKTKNILYLVLAVLSKAYAYISAVNAQRQKDYSFCPQGRTQGSSGGGGGGSFRRLNEGIKVKFKFCEQQTDLIYFYSDAPMTVR